MHREKQAMQKTENGMKETFTILEMEEKTGMIKLGPK